MPSVEVEEALGLDPRRILRKASATEDYARSLLARAEEDQAAEAELRFRAASALTSAGSLWSLIDANRAIAVFGDAAAAHYSVGSPYATFLEICAQPSQPEFGAWEKGISAGLPGAGILASVWPIVAGQIDLGLDQIMEGAPYLREVPSARVTGRLRIPYGYFLNLAYELDRLRRSDEHPREFDATLAFLYRGAETIEAAREDRFHWQSLRTPVLPAEPEILAALTLVEQGARNAGTSPAAEAIGLRPGTLPGALMTVAENLLDASSEAGTELPS